MTTRQRARAPRSDRARRPGRALAALAAVALLVSAWVHGDLADRPWYADGQVTVTGLFLGQAVGAVAVACWLLVRPGRQALLAGAGLGLASLLALVVTVHVEVPALWLLPAVHEPLWYPRKVVAAGAAAVAAGAAALALVVRPR